MKGRIIGSAYICFLLVTKGETSYLSQRARQKNEDLFFNLFFEFGRIGDIFGLV